MPMAYVGTPRLLGNDIETLASIIQGEAGGEGLLGMQAVADVIRNRAQQNFSGYGSNPLDQALARNQFQGQSSKISPEAMAVAEQLKTGQIPSVTKGALYYANPGASTASWAKRLNEQNALKIGNHYFTNNAEGQPFAASPYAGLADGPKGQESYPGLARETAPHPLGGILANIGIPQDAADEIAATLSGPDPGEKSPLQNMFSALAQTPNAPPVRFGPMGDARQTGGGLLAALNAPKIQDLLLKQRMG
jgi:Cell Wall Hydrolase